MGKILRILVVAVALAASAGATIRATDTLPSESLVVTASSLGQRALNDPAAFDFVESLTTEIGQRLAGTEAHRRAVAMGRGQAESSGLRERALRAIYLPRLDPRRRKRGDCRFSAAASCCDRIGRLGRDGC